MVKATNLKDEAARDIDQSICADNGQSCSGHNSDCCSDFCWCSAWNPFCCTCAPRDSITTNAAIEADLETEKNTNGTGSEEEPLAHYSDELENLDEGDKPKPKPATKCTIDPLECTRDEDCCSEKCTSGKCHGLADRAVDSSNHLSISSNDVDLEEGTLGDGGVPNIPTCHANKAKCAKNADCCSNNCETGRCQKKLFQARNAVPPIPPKCLFNKAKCTTSAQCCSGNCDTSSAQCQSKSLEDRIASLSGQDSQTNESDDQTSSYNADVDGPVPPPPCKLGGVHCGNDRECCHGKCMANAKCWKPQTELS